MIGPRVCLRVSLGLPGLASLLGASAHALQDEGPPPIPPLEAPAEIYASDGKPAAPGRIPENVAPAALERWRLALAQIGADGARPPIASFSLELDVIRYPAQGGSNQTDAGFRYLEDPRGPFLRAFLERRNLVVLRGPSGDFLIDGEETKPLLGREAFEDRRKLDEYVGICRNFLSLTRPDQLRLVRLETRELAPSEEGDTSADVRFQGDARLMRLASDEDATLARSLKWLYIESPDFRLAAGTGGGNEIARAWIGIEPQRGEVRLALLAEAGLGPIVDERALCVEVHEYRKLEGGWTVPNFFTVRPVDASAVPLRFAPRECTVLWLKKESRINPPLTSADFLPR